MHGYSYIYKYIYIYMWKNSKIKIHSRIGWKEKMEMHRKKHQEYENASRKN